MRFIVPITLSFLTAAAAAAFGQEVTVWAADTSVFVSRGEQRPPSSPVWNDGCVTVKGARGEWVSFQLVINSRASRLIAFQLYDLEGPRGKLAAANVDVYLGRYNSAGVVEYLSPARAAVEVAAGENAVLWFDIFIPGDTFAGKYLGEVKLKWSGGELAVPVQVTVWDFDLPPERALRVFSSWSASDLEQRLPPESPPERRETLVAAYEKLLKDHGIRNATDVDVAGEGGLFGPPERKYKVISFGEAEAYGERVSSVRAEGVEVAADASDLLSAGSLASEAQVLGWAAWRFGLAALWLEGKMALGEGEGRLAGFVPAAGGGVDVLPSVRLKLIRDALEDYEYLRAIGAGGYGGYAAELATGLVPHAGDLGDTGPEAAARVRETAAVANVKVKWRQGIADNAVAGTVWDEKNEPVAGALVRAGDLAVVADMTGRYEIRYIPRGAPLTAEAAGYRSSGASVAGGRADFYLPRAPRRYLLNGGEKNPKIEGARLTSLRVAGDAGPYGGPAVVVSLNGGKGELSFAPRLNDWRSFTALTVEIYNGSSADLELSIVPAARETPSPPPSFPISPRSWRKIRWEWREWGSGGWDRSSVKRVVFKLRGSGGAEVRVGRVWLEGPLAAE